MTPARWLMVAIAAYFAVAFSLSWLRAIELQTTTWDQGLYQQAIWMSAHGRPFYETADVETGGYGSLLDVHSVFLLYLVVPIYALLPYEATLFAVQSAVVGAAAIPLYYLAKDLSGSPRWGLVTGLLYLCWTPTLSSNLYDFHAEAFLPIEIFALVLLWRRERYRLGLATAVVAFLTFEFAPAIVFMVGVFFLLPSSRAASGDRPSARSEDATRFQWLARWFEPARVRASVVLLIASVAAYGLLLWVRLDVLPALLGTYPLPVSAQGYVIGASPAALGLSGANLTVGFGAKLTYWVLVLGLLGFVPLIAPRALVLSAPWFAFTLLSANTNYVTLGFQYGFLAGSTLFVAFAYALPRVQRAIDSWRTRRPTPVGGARAWFVPVHRRGPYRPAVVLGFALLLAVNVALSPINPAMQNQGLGSGYRLSYDPSTFGGDVEQLAGLIPTGATVLATDDLFPLVANDANAYSFLWAVDPQLALPFSLDHLPSYVFLSEDRTAAVVSWLQGALYNRTLFGLLGVAWSSAEGSVLLFQHGYAGAPRLFGPTPALGGTFYGLRLASESDGFPTTASESTFPTVVESVPGETGTVWYGPDISLPRGEYTVTVSIRLLPIPGFPAPNATAPALWVGAFAFGQPSFYGSTLSYGVLNGTSFTNLSFPVLLSEPTIEFVVQGQLIDSSAMAELNFLAIAPGVPP